jgi:hypothetical protein
MGMESAILRGCLGPPIRVNDRALPSRSISDQLRDFNKLAGRWQVNAFSGNGHGDKLTIISLALVSPLPYL